MPAENVKAIFFDVFGTVVDWRGGVIREGERLGERHGLPVDWAAFADAWRGEYAPSMQRVRGGELPWTPLDGLHRESLDRLLERFGITGLSEREKEHLNHAWHRLDPWPDSVPGLTRLREEYVIAPLSNGNVSLLVDMARRAGLPWDVILSAELARRYKPDPEAYLASAALLDLPPTEVMMAAAHPDDLRAAAALGFRTAYIHRPHEWGLRAKPPVKPADSEFGLVTESIEELADRLT
ncbi:haloacid dehalogenase type II [Rubrobacter aplysinae]|uniref:haloacid dehalogenase type II n=1 Tax=Rubrobacter aplysinae TaxID=909625 RepID=UPI00064C2344|nr:haloacid dehalogenase type II [Rubrobacter aplysinae]